MRVHSETTRDVRYTHLLAGARLFENVGGSSDGHAVGCLNVDQCSSSAAHNGSWSRGRFEEDIVLEKILFYGRTKSRKLLRIIHEEVIIENHTCDRNQYMT